MAELPILIIDDEAELGEILAEFLGSTYPCQVYADGEKALAAIASQRFAAVLSDLHMPQVNGLQIVEAVKRHQPTTPVLLLTGSTPYDPLAKQALAQGASGLITKPFHSASEILVCLQKLLKVP